MAINKTGGLTAGEKKIVKRLLQRKWRNQDIQAQLNLYREVTVNSGRITDVKQDPKQVLATDAEADFFLKKKKSYDPQTV